MKKAVISIALLCYLAVSSGVVVSFHYCMNRLSSTKLFVSGTKYCSKCGMQKHKSHGCCRDEIKVVKMQDDQNQAQVASSLKAPVATINIPSSFILTSFYNAGTKVLYSGHPPPILSRQDIYLQNGVFRI